MSVSADSDNEDESLESLTQHLARHTQQRPLSAHSMAGAVCCCGSDQCESMRKTQDVLQELESQMKIAGSLGQALLKRHENSMADAETRHASAAITISELEMRTAELEFENSGTIEENKRLLHTLEELNSNMTLSEHRVGELQEDLDAAHVELSRVSAHAARTAVLEAQLAILESEQEELRNTIATTKEEERAAQTRWRKAERRLMELEQQLERIDREHALEKARSQNILERMEQRKLASQKTGAFPNPIADKSALSRFMKEILAENGHLQLGVAELRDMLAQSQEEVYMLREKLEDIETDRQRARSDITRQPLAMELVRSPSQTAALGGVIVHHHHYHAPSGSKATIKPVIRRPKKKRDVTLEHFNALRIRGFDPSSSSTPVNAFPKRWSSSTGPLSSSPTSTFRESSVFDRLDNGEETSRPTSVDSNYPPPWPKQSWTKHNRASSKPPPFTILHTTEEAPSEPDGSQPDPPPPIQVTPLSVPVLKRSVSHESLLSISAMDPKTYLASPAPSASSFVSRGRSPNLKHGSMKADDPQASITHGIAIRDQPGNGQYGGSAYSRLLGLHQAESCGTSPPTSVGKPSSRKSSATSNAGSGWFWKYVTLAPGGSRPGRTEEPPQAKKLVVATKPAVGYVDEGLLRESLIEGPGLS